ncbi:hypothetical protein [Neptuniibacter marinus]|uniref:hypothetical protein n=1 Tax=Neptuniibacter marinus TaxID=1806670 RepID=UPI00082983B8|nr:hypothetical protein [Neptuniibacter marinus]
MSEKIVRYAAICIGLAVTLAILYINDGNFSRYGLFAQSIKDTAAFDILRQIAKEFTRYSTARNWAYFLWFVCLGTGLLLSWKCRFKTATVLTKLIKYIHKKV